MTATPTTETEAPIDEVEAAPIDAEAEAKPAKPEPPKRVPLSLAAMEAWIRNMRLRSRMTGKGGTYGPAAGEAWVLLMPEDHNVMQQIEDTLLWVRTQRLKERDAAARKHRRG